MSPTHAAPLPTQLFESEAETLPPAAAAVVSCLGSCWVVEGAYVVVEAAEVEGAAGVVATGVVATGVVGGATELVDGDGAWTGAFGATGASVVVLVTVGMIVETAADALVTTGATLLLEVVATAAKLPP